MLKVVRAGPRDAGLVAPLFDAYRSFYGQRPDLQLARSFLAERLERGESVVSVATEGGKPVGFAQLYPIFSSVAARRKWLLNDLFVMPEARGRGVGRLLLDEARRLAVETDARGLLLETAPDNVAAQRLYESSGWKRDRAFHYYLEV